MRRTLLLLLFAIVGLTSGSHAGLILGSGGTPNPAYLIMGGNRSTLVANTSNYHNIGGGGQCDISAPGKCASIMPNTGTLTNIYIGFTVATGTGSDKRTFTVQKCTNNGGYPDFANCFDDTAGWVDTNIIAECGAADQSCIGTGSVSFVRGDMLVTKQIHTDTPVAQNAQAYGARIVPAVANELMLTGGYFSSETNARVMMLNAGRVARGSNAGILGPVPPGTIKDCMVATYADLAATETSNFTLILSKSATAQSMDMDLSDTVRYDEDVTNDYDLAAVNYLAFSHTPVNRTNGLNYPWGCTYIPDEANASYFASTGISTGWTAPSYAEIGATSTGTVSISGQSVEWPVAFTMVDAWAAHQTDPAPGSITSSLYDDTASIGTVTITGAANTIVGPVTVDTTIAADSIIALLWDDVGSPPTTNWVFYTFTMAID